MNEEIENIKKSIEIINHNSTKIETSLTSLCGDLKEMKLNFNDHLENFLQLKVVLGQVQESIDWLKKLNFWILTTILVGTMMSIVGGILFILIK